MLERFGGCKVVIQLKLQGNVYIDDCIIQISRRQPINRYAYKMASPVAFVAKYILTKINDSTRVLYE